MEEMPPQPGHPRGSHASGVPSVAKVFDAGHTCVNTGSPTPGHDLSSACAASGSSSDWQTWPVTHKSTLGVPPRIRALDAHAASPAPTASCVTSAATARSWNGPSWRGPPPCRRCNPRPPSHPKLRLSRRRKVSPCPSHASRRSRPHPAPRLSPRGLPLCFSAPPVLTAKTIQPLRWKTRRWTPRPTYVGWGAWPPDPHMYPPPLHVSSRFAVKKTEAGRDNLLCLPPSPGSPTFPFTYP